MHGPRFLLCIYLKKGDKTCFTDVQFSFRSGVSRVDAIFAFQSIFNRILCKQQTFIFCFLDNEKAFDCVDRTKLWKQLFNSGIQEKMLTIIRYLYDKVKCCV